MSNETKKVALSKFERVSKGKKCLNSKIKNLYIRNKEVIDTINKYSDINSYIAEVYFSYFYNYDFYEYIKKHEDEKEKMLAILEKLKELEFDEINLDENADFTEERCRVVEYYNNTYIPYFDNMQAIANYEDESILCTTTGSNYKMLLPTKSRLIRLITLNSLVFDVERLPNKINAATAWNNILKMEEKTKDKSKMLDNSVNFSVSVDKLESQIGTVSDIIRIIDDVNDKEELLKIMLQISKSVQRIKDASSEYERKVVDEIPCIKEQTLQYIKNEKRKVKR